MGKTLARSKKLAPSISIRFDYDLANSIETDIKNGKFEDRTEGIEHYVRRGMQLDSITEIYKDPKKRKEFEDKFGQLVSEKNVESVMETADVEQLKTIIFFAKNQLDKRFNQLLISTR